MMVSFTVSRSRSGYIVRSSGLSPVVRFVPFIATSRLKRLRSRSSLHTLSTLRSVLFSSSGRASIFVPLRYTFFKVCQPSTAHYWAGASFPFSNAEKGTPIG